MIKLLMIVILAMSVKQPPVWYVLDCFTRNHTGVFTNVPPGHHVVWVEIKCKETITYAVTVSKVSDLKVILSKADSTKLYVIVTKGGR